MAPLNRGGKPSTVLSAAPRTASDHNPAALAATRLNAGRLGVPVAVTEGGDLFAPVAGRRFDLVIFNAPWVVAPARTLAESALNDAGQTTVRRFLWEVRRYLNPGGRVVLGYADHSGPQAMANLERFITEAGLQTEQRLTDRIKTHRRHRSWETVCAYVLK